MPTKHRSSPREAFGWEKNLGGLVQTDYRGVEWVRSRFILLLAAQRLLCSTITKMTSRRPTSLVHAPT